MALPTSNVLNVYFCSKFFQLGSVTYSWGESHRLIPTLVSPLICYKGVINVGTVLSVSEKCLNSYLLPYVSTLYASRGICWLPNLLLFILTTSCGIRKIVLAVVYRLQKDLSMVTNTAIHRAGTEPASPTAYTSIHTTRPPLLFTNSCWIYKGSDTQQEAEIFTTTSFQRSLKNSPFHAWFTGLPQ